MTATENRIADVDMQTILSAWNDATDRLRRTHETLRDEVRRLTDELEIKNRELARKNRLADLGQMAAHVAHEVRNSLVPMKLYLSLLNRRLSDDSGSQDIFEKISSGFVALEATVSDLLNFSAERDPQRRDVDVETLLNEVYETFAPQLEAQGIATHIDADPHAMIYADPDMLRRAIINLVLNALDVMPGGGELVMTACQTRRGLEIEVADSGPGITSGTLPRLFEPFFTTKGAGTGLGLAIVERIAAAHGGIVYAANCPEGGAAFTLCLPTTHNVSLLRAAA
ncbi:MAG: HAMP domain-containing histidine kinase [Planctomycetales bacterium]|nr:HAMP domain-containing histidine kinase [Planctomycetales bacterium]